MQYQPTIPRDLHEVVVRKAEATRRYAESPSRRSRAIASKVGKICWYMLPNWVLSTSLFLKLGKLIHNAHIRWAGRHQTNSTRFLRNVPLLELLRDLVLRVPGGVKQWRVVVIGCSTGAEVYSLLWYLRSARPKFRIFAIGVDVIDGFVAKAVSGVSSPEDEELLWLSDPVLESFFDHVGGALRVKDWIRKDIRWTVADAMNPKLLDELGPTDLLLANNFLGAMPDEEAEASMENLLRLVLPGGYFVFNGNLDVKSRFVKKQKLVAVDERIEAIHFGDPLRLGWPWTYFASEPIDKNRSDWRTRYSAVFVRPVEISKNAMSSPAARRAGDRTLRSKAGRSDQASGLGFRKKRRKVVKSASP
jgi:chemotaxis methyl-accepting protein methylase